MRLPQLFKYFPATNALAELYNGWLEAPYFKKTFTIGSRSEKILTALSFIEDNGFVLNISENDFENNDLVDDGLLSLDFKTLGPNILLLIYQQPLLSKPLDSIINLITLFRDDRDWKQFHDPKNLAMAIGSETGELMDLLLWDRDKKPNTKKIANELADIFIYLLLLSKELNIDLYEAAIEKIKINDVKYPNKEVKGTAKKYNER